MRPGSDELVNWLSPHKRLHPVEGLYEYGQVYLQEMACEPEVSVCVLVFLLKDSELPPYISATEIAVCAEI